MNFRFYLWLYDLVKPYYDKLYNKVYPTIKQRLDAAKAALRKQLQDEQFKLAENLQKQLWAKYGTPKQRLESELYRILPDNCRHLKGGSYGPKALRKDYAVRFFTFPNGTSNIKCTICGQEWTRESADWQKAIEMTEQSTNTKGSSEYSMLVGETTGKRYTKEELKPGQLRGVRPYGEPIVVVHDNLFQ